MGNQYVLFSHLKTINTFSIIAVKGGDVVKFLSGWYVSGIFLHHLIKIVLKWWKYQKHASVLWRYAYVCICIHLIQKVAS